MPEHQYLVGDIVWLIETGPPDYDELCPRQLAEILVCEDIKMARDPSDGQMKPDEMYVVRVDPMDSEDDGLREIQVELIERRATDEEAAAWTSKMTPQAKAYLQQAGPYIGYEEHPE